ncbi:unnamed protein product, partial [Phaeothamnion confervicola]
TRSTWRRRWWWWRACCSASPWRPPARRSAPRPWLVLWRVAPAALTGHCWARSFWLGSAHSSAVASAPASFLHRARPRPSEHRRPKRNHGKIWKGPFSQAGRLGFLYQRMRRRVERGASNADARGRTFSRGRRGSPHDTFNHLSFPSYGCA